MSIQLRDVYDSDLPIFFEHQLDPVASQMAAFPSRDRESFMAHWRKNLRDPANVNKTILYEGRVAGNIVSFMMEGKREVGYWLGREFWGKRIATQALSMFLQLIDTRPLYGIIARHNKGSRRVLENCGFRQFQESEEEINLVLD